MNNDSRLPDFSELLLQLYRLAQRLPITEFQDAVLGLLKPVLPFDSSLWGTASGKPGGADIHTVHLHNKPVEMLTAYESVKHQDTAVATMFSRERMTRGFHLESWFADPAQHEIRDVMRRFGIENMLATAVHDPRTRFAHWLLLYRADKDAICTAEEVACLELLAPHVMEALAINRQIHLERLAPRDTGSPMRGSAIVDLRGVMYHADVAFRELLRLQWPEWRDGPLPSPLLHHFAQGHARYTGSALVVTQRLEQRLLFLKCRPRCPADDLTPREHTIAQMVSRGDTHKEIARILQRSPATVRNHMQAIYDKLAIGNVAGLIEALRLAD